MLQRKGYTVLTAGSGGGEALEKLQRQERRVDLLLTDVIMPDINGRELFEAVAEMNPDIRVLYMSGYTEDVIAHHGVLDPGVYFIQTPFSAKDLAAKIRKVLDS
ncbi:MAG: response regulator [Thermodesulfobacteriota bacterium]